MRIQELLLFGFFIFQAPTQPRLDFPRVSEEMYKWAIRLIMLFERKDKLENTLPAEEYERNPKPTVLIFLPGIFEIEEMYNMLEKWCLL